jgi:CRP-like cAMP-binding protein/predicted MFS family arabinose efflux permease
LGDWLYNIGLVVYVLEETGSPAWVAAAGMGRMLPYLVFSALGGTIADRYERRTVMMASDLTRAALMVVMAVSAAADAPALVVVGIAFFSTTAGTAYEPAASALTPAVLKEEDLAAANALRAVLDNVAMALGPALGGVLLVLGPPPMAFALNAVSFVLGAILVRAMRTRSVPPEAEQGTSTMQQLREGWTAVRASSDVAVILGVAFTVHLLYGQDAVVLVLASERLLDLGPEGAGYLYASIGLGGIIGATLINRLSEDSRPGRTLFVGLVISGAAFIVLGLTSQAAVGIGAMMFDGLGGVIIDVLSITLLQRLVARDVLARATGILITMSVAGLLVGMLIAPILIDLLDLRRALVVGGAIVPVVALLAAPKFRDMNRRADAIRRQFADIVDFIRDLGIFTGATRQSLELIARNLEEIDVDPKANVVVEGEPADAFYVVREGTLDVWSRGERGGRPLKVNKLGPGDYFGEIGLLEEIPRTATVRAATRCVLYKISGEDFISVFTRSPLGGRSMHDTIAGRLARTHPSKKPAKGYG